MPSSARRSNRVLRSAVTKPKFTSTVSTKCLILEKLLMPSRPVARPMDNGRAINYKAQQCLQAQTRWCWQERENRPDRGCSSGVEHNLAKVGVVGSNPIARSKFSLQFSDLPVRFRSPRIRDPVGRHRVITDKSICDT